MKEQPQSENMLKQEGGAEQGEKRKIEDRVASLEKGLKLEKLLRLKNNYCIQCEEEKDPRLVSILERGLELVPAEEIQGILQKAEKKIQPQVATLTPREGTGSGFNPRKFSSFSPKLYQLGNHLFTGSNGEIRAVQPVDKQRIKQLPEENLVSELKALGYEVTSKVRWGDGMEEEEVKQRKYLGILMAELTNQYRIVLSNQIKELEVTE